MAGKLKITLVKSTIGAIPKHRATVEALGLKKLNKTVELPDRYILQPVTGIKPVLLRYKSILYHKCL